MYFSYRFIRMDGPQWIKEFLEKTTGLEVIVRNPYRMPVITDKNNPYVKSLYEAMCRKWEGVCITKMSCATDATRYAHLNLPTVIFGSSVEFCHKIGLDYVSCSPFRVPIARLAAAQAAISNK